MRSAPVRSPTRTRTSRGQPSIRDYEWTLHLRGEQDGASELYHLSSDPAQARNVIAQYPEVAGRLHSEFVSFLRQIDTDEAKVKIVESWLEA